MKRLVIVLALVVSVGLNAKNLSDEEFYELVNDCLDNDNKVSCQKLVESKLLASVDKCKDTCGNIGMVFTLLKIISKQIYILKRNATLSMNQQIVIIWTCL